VGGSPDSTCVCETQIRLCVSRRHTCCLEIRPSPNSKKVSCLPERVGSQLLRTIQDSVEAIGEDAHNRRIRTWLRPVVQVGEQKSVLNFANMNIRHQMAYGTKKMAIERTRRFLNRTIPDIQCVWYYCCKCYWELVPWLEYISELPLWRLPKTEARLVTSAVIQQLIDSLNVAVRILFRPNALMSSTTGRRTVPPSVRDRLTIFLLVTAGLSN
jgi:hypothetical protein